MLQSITDSTFPTHSTAGVRALSYRLLGLCALSGRAFSYSTTQDLTLHLDKTQFFILHSQLILLIYNTEPCSIYL